jgi:isoquinoline 1-oxidoreductase alpha subunit
MVEINVNGARQSVEAEPETPLLWVLRDLLGLTGTKYGCGIGACGACMVLLDGVAVHSCQLPLSSVDGGAITTIEGLSATGDHPVQVAWRKLGVPQCGYCQSGQIIAAAGLLAAHPDPDDATITAAMDGNVCRCGTYIEIRAAIHEAALLLRGASVTTDGGP